MITKEQCKEARRIVAEYEDQEYHAALERIKREWPIGTKVENQNSYTTGTIYGYGRSGTEVTLKVRSNNGYTGHFLAKYARKVYKP